MFENACERRPGWFDALLAYAPASGLLGITLLSLIGCFLFGAAAGASSCSGFGVFALMLLLVIAMFYAFGAVDKRCGQRMRQPGGEDRGGAHGGDPNAELRVLSYALLAQIPSCWRRDSLRRQQHNWELENLELRTLQHQPSGVVMTRPAATPRR